MTYTPYRQEQEGKRQTQEMMAAGNVVHLRAIEHEFMSRGERQTGQRPHDQTDRDQGCLLSSVETIFIDSQTNPPAREVLQKYVCLSDGKYRFDWNRYFADEAKKASKTAEVARARV